MELTFHSSTCHCLRKVISQVQTQEQTQEVRLPDAMLPYVERMDFILGAQATKTNNCGVITFGNTVYANFIRNSLPPNLERHFYQVLRQLGISATVESNQQEE